METYTYLRQFADMWVLLGLFSFFIGVVIWVFRPGSGKTYTNIADIPFRYSDAPASVRADDGSADSPADAKETRQ
jgi:cytochrome c oxidase cbb3-type subunit IV